MDTGATHTARAPMDAPVAHSHSHGVPVLGALQRSVGSHCPGVQVVGEHRRGADEDSVGEARRFVDQRVILQLAVRTDDNPRTHVGAATDVAVAAYCGVLADLRQVPDPCSVSNDGGVCHVCGFGDGSHGTPPDKGFLSGICLGVSGWVRRCFTGRVCPDDPDCRRPQQCAQRVVQNVAEAGLALAQRQVLHGFDRSRGQRAADRRQPPPAGRQDEGDYHPKWNKEEYVGGPLDVHVRDAGRQGVAHAQRR